MASVGYRIRSKVNKSVNIYLYLNQTGRPTVEAKTGFSITPNNWSQSKQRAKTTDPFLKNLNSNLEKLNSHVINQTNIAQSKGIFINKNWLQSVIEKCFKRVSEDSASLVSNHIQHYINTSISKKGKNGKIGLSQITIERWKYFKNIVHEYQESISTLISFDMIDKSFSEGFTMWLLKDKCYSINTAGKFISQLKTICKDAMNYGINVNPYFNQIISFSQQRDDRYINIINLEEIEKIKKLKLKNIRLDNVRKWLLFGLCIGQRVSDLLKLNNACIRDSGKGYLYVDVRQKKGNKDITAVIQDKYIGKLIKNDFPYKISSQKFNDYLKEVCKEAGIENICKGYKKNNETNRNELVELPKYELLSSHDLRRSFATNYFGKVPTHILMNITGHTRESTFLLYIGKYQNKDSYADAFINSIK